MSFKGYTPVIFSIKHQLKGLLMNTIKYKGTGLTINTIGTTGVLVKTVLNNTVKTGEQTKKR